MAVSPSFREGLRHHEVPFAAQGNQIVVIRRIERRYPYDLTESAFSSSNANLDRVYEFCKYSTAALTYPGAERVAKQSKDTSYRAWFTNRAEKVRALLPSLSTCDAGEGFTFEKRLGDVRYVVVVNDRRLPNDGKRLLTGVKTNDWYRPVSVPQSIATHLKVHHIAGHHEGHEHDQIIHTSQGFPLGCHVCYQDMLQQRERFVFFSHTVCKITYSGETTKGFVLKNQNVMSI